ncbi:coenzyme F420-0:L-glutamate ligase / coenzyme F420-1:gamma-L-glutamate ligase [Microlunatus sagamiharensis]|uniref:Coenzyme F420-0:L-glutamate ligase / coenzyme F420-1:gamma-L-glutamate ligase n=1 Tax=Microlunatus sagamiharensis TaxID=546874 RepID=A0A1H2LLV9_9ACTN|nr:coenzyme F420-0:L-glutamate ligase [Microlunatus sagamiharensis]SDU81832.1 coenzyme F420-0:L-glutamate ligase / coenzyme F420-1:gamma-L-glutamate ligase [Microlunatus sagamiharensis]
MTGPGRAEVSVLALGGIGEVHPGDDLAALVLDAAAGDPAGPLRDGDVLVVTSKVVSKSEGRSVPAEARESAIREAAVHTLARRGPTRIVRDRNGLVLAAAGVDNSNVDPGRVLLLPVDPDASAARIRSALRERAGVDVGVVVSDTLGRAWRLGQTDVAIGAAGVRVVEDYAGRTDTYGNDLHVTAVALADELASAADLVKTKLAGRPVALVRGLAHLVGDDAGTARDLARDPAQDMFGHGSQEAVLAAVLEAVGQPGRYEELLDLPREARARALLDGPGGEDLEPAAAALVERLLVADLHRRDA